MTQGQIMTDKLMKIPGPDHPLSIEANPSRVVVTVGGKVIADTCAALTLREASHPAVQYIPRRDVDMGPRSRVANTPRIAPTRATLPTTAFRLAGIVRSMRCGRMRRHLKRWRRSRITSPSTRTVSTRSANDAGAWSVAGASPGANAASPVLLHGERHHGQRRQ